MTTTPEKRKRPSDRKTSATGQKQQSSKSRPRPSPKRGDWKYEKRASSPPIEKDPALIACRLMLEAMLSDAEDADLITWQQVCVVLQIYRKEWQTSTLDTAWRELMIERRGRSAQTPGIESRWEIHLGWRRHLSDYLAEMRVGRSILVAASDLSDVEPIMFRAADATLRLDAPTPQTVAAIIAKLTGKPMVWDVPESLCAKITPDLLRLSFRRRQHPEDLLDRLLKLADIPEEAAPSPGGGKKAALQPDPAALDRIHGASEAVAWGRSLGRDLLAFKEGTLPWSDVDRGAVLTGPPGCGKTTFAKALARFCGVPLISTSYGDWQSAGSGHLGDVTKCLRQRFADARGAAPCILFIDELDSVGTRGKRSNYDDWWRAIINALLAELDGVEGRQGVVVIGATNDVDHVDPAILRSGRMDRVIRMTLPDEVAIAAILKDHLGDTAQDGLNLGLLARQGLGSNGADCERWARGARRRARAEHRHVTASDVLMEIGADDDEDEATRFRAAVHEAGHAVVLETLNPGTVRLASIRKSGSRVGFVAVNDAPLTCLPADIDRLLIERLSGRAAEQVCFGAADAGAGGEDRSDLAYATRWVVRAELSLGLGACLVWHGPLEAKDVGGILASCPDLVPVVSDRLDLAHARAVEIVRQRQAEVLAIARALMAVVVLSGDEVRAILDEVVVRA